MKRDDSGDAPRRCDAVESHDDESLRPRTFTLVRKEPIWDLSVGKPPRVAVASAEGTLLFDGTTWKNTGSSVDREQIPEVRLFFGRDNLPRRMGTLRTADAKLRTHYQRFREGRWHSAPDELGPLASATDGLYGVLGHEDPEVVCQPKRFCLVKRVDGWKRAPAHETTVRIVVASGRAYALRSNAIEELSNDGWTLLKPEHEWRAPRALWAGPDTDVWAIDDDGVFRRVGGGWRRLPAPLENPAGVLGIAGEAVWFVGEGGAVGFDGKRFFCVAGVRGPLTLIRYDGVDLWIAGETGLWRGTRNLETQDAAQ